MPQRQEVLTKDELVEWFLHPVTKKVRHKIDMEVIDAQARLGNGCTLDSESVDRTAIRTAREVGLIEGLMFLVNIEADE